MIRWLALCGLLLLSACSARPTTPAASPSASPPISKTVEVYDHNPRPAALELPFVPADITVAQFAVDPHGTLTAATGVVPAWTSTCETQPDALTFK
jgi:hypothetical protein